MNIDINGVSITLTQDQLEQIAQQTAKKSTIYIPEIDQKYWCIDLNGFIIEYCWVGNKFDKAVLDYGNVYKTREEAEKARDIQLAKVRLRNAIAEANGNWIPDWNDEQLTKFYFSFNKAEDSIKIGYTFEGKIHPDWMYISCLNAAESILAKHSDDIKLILSE